MQDSRTGRLLEVNESMVRMYGYSSREELMACSIGDLSANVAPFSETEAQQRDAMAVQGQPQIFEWVARKKNGELFNVEVSLTCSPIRGKNRVLAAVRDIKERKLAQDALRKANERLEATVHERTAQLKHMTAKLIHAEEAERERIGRVLHDDLQQILVALRLSLESVSDGAARADLQARAIAMVDEAIRVTRSLSMDMLPPVVVEAGFKDGLAWLLEDVRQRFGLDVSCEGGGDIEPKSETVRLFAYRAIRELCLNIVKHAQVKSARLVLAPSGEGIRIEISDEGAGFDASRTPVAGVGLFRIRQEASHLGGDLHVTSAPGAGTRVVLILPAS